VTRKYRFCAIDKRMAIVNAVVNDRVIVKVEMTSEEC
jgi:hypothetical protein